MATVSADSVAQNQIKAFVERIERLEEERKAIARDIAEVYAEAKGNGFDRKALKAVVRIRAQDHADRMEHEALVELYLNALGMSSAFDDDDEQPSHVHVHVREEGPDHDPETGEIIDHEIPGNDAEVAEDEVRVALVASSSAQPDPVANVGEGVNGAIAAASVDPASREADGADRQQLAASGFSGDAAVASQPTHRDVTDEPVREAPSLAVAPVTELTTKKRWTFSDPAHRDCLDPGMCGGFSNLKLCQRCREAAEIGQVA